ncbi:glycosyltransferase, partial [Streptococcus suis]
ILDGNTDLVCVGTRRVSRDGEPQFRIFFAKLFYKLMNKIRQVEVVDGVRDFRLMRLHMVDAILSLSEYNRFSIGIFACVVF